MIGALTHVPPKREQEQFHFQLICWVISWRVVPVFAVGCSWGKSWSAQCYFCFTFVQFVSTHNFDIPQVRPLILAWKFASTCNFNATEIITFPKEFSYFCSPQSKGRVYTGPPGWSTRLNQWNWIQRLNDTVCTVPQKWTRQSIPKWRQMNLFGKVSIIVICDSLIKECQHIWEKKMKEKKRRWLVKPWIMRRNILGASHIVSWMDKWR